MQQNPEWVNQPTSRRLACRLRILFAGVVRRSRTPTGLRVVCAAQPVLGHAIPVSILAEALKAAGHDVHMVVHDDPVRRFYLRRGLRQQLRARRGAAHDPDAMLSLLREVQPDVVVCDWRKDLWLATQVMRPRCTVSILRCEQFIGYRRLSTHLPNKFPGHWPGTSWLERHGLRRLRRVRELYRADVMVVPSLPELDPPPPHLHLHYPRSRFVYTGPLTIDAEGPLPAPVTRWLAARRRERRRVLLVTLGTAVGAPLHRRFAAHLQRHSLATLMTVPDERLRAELAAHSSEDLLLVGFSPLLSLMRTADVIMHHGGHATSLLAALSGRPTLTVPTFEYDREDMAIRLERLGCNARLSARSFAAGLDLEGLIGSLVEDRRMARSAALLARRAAAQSRRAGAAAALDAITSHLEATR
jgi:UDP:flavonoid glycosyltransferase YjiC (YdhE family)